MSKEGLNDILAAIKAAKDSHTEPQAPHEVYSYPPPSPNLHRELRKAYSNVEGTPKLDTSKNQLSNSEIISRIHSLQQPEEPIFKRQPHNGHRKR
jgi:hypothetical protein